MRKKIFMLVAALLLLTCPAMAASLRQHQVTFVDEFGDAVTSITSITVFNVGAATSPTIYSDRAGAVTVTNPITTTSTNSTFDQSLGLVRWFQRGPAYKITVTDGSKTLTIDNRDEGDTRFPWYDNYIGTAASLSVTDNQSITVGGDSDMVLAWNNGSDFMSWIPASDGSAFNLGTSGTGANVDFNWFVGSALGIKGDEGAATLVIDGVTTSINASSNFATNINTGTSTGAVTIGSATSGTLALDTTSGMTINADDSIDMTTSGAAADIDIDAAAGSVIIDGGEAAADAVTIIATGTAGGIDITSLGDIDITTTGAAGEDITITNTGGSIAISATEAVADALTISTTAAGGDLNLDSVLGRIEIEAEEDVANAVYIIADGATASTIKIHNDTGTSDESILLASDVGGITVNAAAGSVDIEAVGAETGDIILNSGDDMTFTVTGDLTLAVSGTFAGGGATMNNFYSTTEVVTGTTDTLTAAQSGNMIIYTMTGGACTVTLPEATSGTVGMWFLLVDGNPVAASDLTIDPEGIGTINGDSAGHYIKCENDRDGEAIILFSTAADVWYTVACGSSTVWTEE